MTLESYDSDYFERGVETGKSGYQNYSWLPELTLKMAHHLILNLGLVPGMKVLDYGCAKGYLVKALRILDIDAYGVDVSHYAIEHVDPYVRSFCIQASGMDDQSMKFEKYDWIISKDVFEHLTEAELQNLLEVSSRKVKKMFVAVPLGLADGSSYIIPAYEGDITHKIRRPMDWWCNAFSDSGWLIETVSNSFRGVKDNWHASYPNGNGFFTLSSRRYK